MRTALPPVKQQQTLRSTTLRGFNGGLNTLDNDLNLSYRYSTILNNCFVDSDGIVRVRYGTKLFATLGGVIINMEYYSTAIIAVLDNGNIVRVNGDGSHSVIFSGWGTTTFASFAQFNGHLIICNGSDKPLDVNNDYSVEYLQDAATSTNINVPVCKYVVSNGRYLVMTGDALNPERVHISAKDAAGTWYGDPAPNDATHVDVGSVLSSASTIRGALSFRDRLLILYAEGIVIGKLGAYDASNNHVPTFDDAIEQYGSVSHRVAVARGDDGLFMDLEGVPSIQRTVLSGQLKPERTSTLVDSLIREQLRKLSFETMQSRTFAVYDNRNGQYMLFIPDNDNPASTNAVTCFVYAYRPNLKQDAWSMYTGWNWTCGCRTLEGRIFFGSPAGKIYQYGSVDVPFYVDYLDLPNYDGAAISFQWRTPWIDLGARDKNKSSKHISFDTVGTDVFTCKMYVDQQMSQPALSTLFTGGDDPSLAPATRNTSYKRSYVWPAKFQLCRFDFSGVVTHELAFVSLTLRYQQGSVNR